MIPQTKESGNSFSASRLPLTIFIGLLLIAPLLQAAEKAKGPAARAVAGQAYFTQFSLFHENHNHRTTNYRKGVLVPVNTEVTFAKANQAEIMVRLPDGSNLTIENIEKFSGENIDGIFTRTFSTNKVDLSKFTESERKAILLGSVEADMTKAAVVVALGHPPKHQTPSLRSTQWRYWQNRFNTFIVHFKDDKVSQIQD